MNILNPKSFQVSVKGLHFNDEGKLLMAQEDNGVWGLPGGRAEKGEDLIAVLQRECMEETGLKCQVLENQPSFAYSLDDRGLGRVMLFYKVRFPNLDFTPSDECVALEFFDKPELQELDIFPQLKPLIDLL